MLYRLRGLATVPKLFIQSMMIIRMIISASLFNFLAHFPLSLQVVKDPLFELAITLCIVLNTMFLALEHHGMSENIRQALDIGNKVSIYPS